jgi:hypothetical protein
MLGTQLPMLVRFDTDFNDSLTHALALEKVAVPHPGALIIVEAYLRFPLPWN